MPIAVRGTLVIDRKHGRNGSFNVGDLATEIGEFEVKDALIEEFEPGRYDGLFTIAWIAPDSFAWRGKVFVKNRATLEGMLIDDADEESPPPAAPPEPDPVDAVATATQRTGGSPGPGDCDARHGQASTPAVAQPSPIRSGGTDSMDTLHPGSPDDADARLFGEEIYALVIARQTLKLDRSVDRVLLRQQRDRLYDLDYAFNSKDQSWSPGAEVVPN
jgi:hypothetical protein